MKTADRSSHHAHERTSRGSGPTGIACARGALGLIESQYWNLRDSGRLNDALREWKKAVAGLEDLAEAGDLDNFFGDTRWRWPQRDRILSALCVRAVEAKDDVAAVALMHVLTPRLRRFARTCARYGPIDSDFYDEMLVGFWRGARSVKPGSTYVVVVLERAAHRAGVRYLRREQRVAHASGELVDEPIADDTWVEKILDEKVLTSAVRVGVITPKQLDLLLVEQGDVKKTARDKNMAFDAARSSRKVARAKIRAWLHKDP